MPAAGLVGVFLSVIAPGRISIDIESVMLQHPAVREVFSTNLEGVACQQPGATANAVAHHPPIDLSGQGMP